MCSFCQPLVICSVLNIHYDIHVLGKFSLFREPRTIFDKSLYLPIFFYKGIYNISAALLSDVYAISL